MKRLPPVTLVVCALALAAWFLPALAEWLVYDREFILRGEFWRLFTGHLVHFSRSHLALDVGAFFTVGWLLETRSIAPRWLMFGMAPGVIGLALLFGDPAMARYGGLSGWSVAALVCVALDWIKRAGPARAPGWIALAGLAIKTLGEWQGASPVFASVGSPARLAVLAHVSGALFAFAATGWTRRRSAALINRENPA